MKHGARTHRDSIGRIGAVVVAAVSVAGCGDGGAPIPTLSDLSLVRLDDPMRFAECRGPADELRFRASHRLGDGARLHYDGVFTGGPATGWTGDEPIPSHYVSESEGEIVRWLCEPTVAWVLLDVTVDVELADGRRTDALRAVLPRPGLRGTVR